MHETAIIHQILEELSRREKDKKITSVTLEVGELAPISAHTLKELLEEIVKFKVNVLPVKSQVICDCGYKGEPRVLAREHDFVLIECPKCKRMPSVLSGKEIVIKEIKTK
ncbi:MAG TPA: hydrogenase maturation nickel metallochaperone HypA [Candidatus Nanoarchaeia archaeon]|nr:hydrogenase maturation nickel metallochaperone HypA [Candidatus Nanoarchaeia archaeon]